MLDKTVNKFLEVMCGAVRTHPSQGPMLRTFK